mmetsp:Transcript_12705/g.39351  ORF Transcript_12705/g.39351 Transcript_12705/m.39351 type:complete len:136 (+) Transcript_12705:2-409(+)
MASNILRAPRLLAGRVGPLAVAARRFAASAGAARAQALVQEHGCVIFSKTTCPFCVMAKNVLQAELKAKCHVLEMDRELSPADLNDMRAHFLKTTGAQSFPRVFIGGECVGGGSDVAELHSRGELKAKLEKAGAL